LSNSTHQPSIFSNQTAQKWFFLVPILIFFCVTFFIQTRLVVNWDVTWDLMITKQVLNGGKYIQDFFDWNPPLIFYLYSPAVWIEQCLGISRAYALYGYIYALGLLSFIFCYQLIQKLFASESRLLKNFLSSVILVLFFLLPQADFGEREHLLLILSLPYILLKACRLQKIPVNHFMAGTIGFLAALGFAIKPFFLIIPIILELFTRRLRIETFIMGFVFVCYGLFIIKYFPDFLYSVAPLASDFYYYGFSELWQVVILTPTVAFCYFVITYYIASFNKNPYKQSATILILGMIGFLITYFFQRTNWSYHSYPAFSVAILLSALFFGLFVSRTQKNNFLIVLIGIIVFSYPVAKIGVLFYKARIYKEFNAPLADFIKNNADNKSVYFFTASPSDVFPKVADANAIYASRLLHLFWIPGLVKMNYPNQIPATKKNNEQFFINMVLEDLRVRKPEFIFVDERYFKPFFSYIPFDYLTYFSKQPEFNQIWKHYHYVTTMEGKEISPVNPENWDLYLISNAREIKLKEIEGANIVLTGTGTSRTAYFVDYHVYYKSAYDRISRKIYLSPNQLALLQHTGKVIRTPKNQQIINQIIYNALTMPSYKFAIYQLEKKNES